MALNLITYRRYKSQGSEQMKCWQLQKTGRDGFGCDMAWHNVPGMSSGDWKSSIINRWYPCMADNSDDTCIDADLINGLEL